MAGMMSGFVRMLELRYPSVHFRGGGMEHDCWMFQPDAVDLSTLKPSNEQVINAAALTALPAGLLPVLPTFTK